MRNEINDAGISGSISHSKHKDKQTGEKKSIKRNKSTKKGEKKRKLNVTKLYKMKLLNKAQARIEPGRVRRTTMECVSCEG